MSDCITCPECGENHSIADMELWQVYEQDGQETEIDCNGCDKPLIITSQVIGWRFDCELNE